MENSKKIATPDEMISAGADFAKSLSPGDSVALVGDLGAGKTHFTKGILAGLGYDQDVTSPTFTIVHEYVGGKIPVFHFDFYRLEQDQELIDLGWDDFFDREGIIIAEWADRFPELFPAETQWLRIEHAGEERVLHFEAD